MDVPTFIIQYDGSHWEYQTFKNKSEITEPDGNCVFNAMVLGLCDLVLYDKLPFNDKLYTRMKKQLNLNVGDYANNQWDSFKKWLEIHSRKDWQKNIQLVLRQTSIDIIECKENYEKVYSHVYESQLWNAYLNQKLDDTFVVHNSIKQEFEELEKTTNISQSKKKELLLEWWRSDKGKTKYFDELRQEARSPMDKARWGSITEIDALAFTTN